MKKQIEINIDELVLHGFTPSDGRSIGEALQPALMQAFNDQPVAGTLNQSADIHFVDGGSFTVKQNSRPAQVVSAISNSIHASLANINKSK